MSTARAGIAREFQPGWQECSVERLNSPPYLICRGELIAIGPFVIYGFWINSDQSDQS